jgi:hypothetical protein
MEYYTIAANLGDTDAKNELVSFYIEMAKKYT